MALENLLLEPGTILGKVTGQERAIDDVNITLGIFYAVQIQKGARGVECPECGVSVTANSAIDDVPNGKKDLYGLDDYEAGFHCKICEYTTTEWPSERS